ncbi:hypothetical protein Hypma_000498 [Hypsizygus marmoreus]|uniref:Uncharacterized protein n=1 Tax=Hypsizygus marmoreus TaxID=39966 RepID=A0A369JF24_HYPMA|nr:hypothetical protein Hypma_000498 [Hypsizygus marmoreus]
MDNYSRPNNNSGGGSKTGAIVGGVVGGIAFLLGLIFLTLFLIRRHKRKQEDLAFDGNFDPARVVHSNTNQVDLGADTTGADGYDDGMGGRLGAGAGGVVGGVVSPFTYVPPGEAAVAATGTAPRTDPEMRQRYPVSGEGYPNQSSYHNAASDAGTGSTGGSGNAYHNMSPQNPQYSPQGTGYPNLNVYPAAAGAGPGGNGSGGPLPNPFNGYHPQSQGYSQGDSQVPASLHPGGIAAVGRGGSASSQSHSRTYSLGSAAESTTNTGSGSGSGLGAPSAKEREAYPGRFSPGGSGGLGVVNPDGEGQGSGSGARGSGAGVDEESRLAYLRSGPIVHRDAGRVEGNAEESDEEPAEIPPTYDSLPAEDRR